jgi:hypothetical protein
MTQQIINLGTADKGNGDVLRTAFGKVNANFAELYNQVASGVVVSATAPTGPEEGALWWDPESGRMYVYYGTAWVDASPVDGAGISSTNELVNGAHTVSLGTEGKLTLPAGTTYEYFNTPLTGHGDGLARLDFSLATDGVSAQWLAASPSPAGSGYSVGNTFTFNATFLGIPGASVTIEVLSIGPGGSIDELGFTIPPLYPADIYRDSPINLQVGPESNRWTFGATGTLTLPGDLNVGNNSIREDGLFSQQFSIAAGAGNHVEISSDDGEKVWSFETDGSLTAPGTISAKTTFTLETTDLDTVYETYQELVQQLTDAFTVENYTGQGYPASKDSYAAIVRAKTLNPLIPDSWIPLSNSLRNAYFTWAASSITLTVDGGGFVIANGGGTTWRFEEATGLLFPDNTYQTTAFTGAATRLLSPNTNYNLTVDNYGIETNSPIKWMEGTTERVILNYVPADDRFVIATDQGGTPKYWYFGDNGNLQLPASGNVVNSTGVGQLANRTEGSWTVTSGTNTYSFTVPMDGTYTMWVKGNIPNGIITWNATLSVTNSNVPAIGTQYAWNYTGGGSPILLTTIPDQIRGTAGTISTDATYAGTTSNRFDFGISNTSGASVTVYYGYTKV